MRRRASTTSTIARARLGGTTAWGEAAAGEDLVGAEAAGLGVVAIDQIEQAAGGRVEEAGEEGSGRAVGEGEPGVAAGPGGSDAERVDPEGLHLDGLAGAGGDDPVADLGVHPGELLAGAGGMDEAVRVHADAVAGAVAVGGEDGRAGGLQGGGGAGVGGAEREQVADGDDEPEAGVDAVELGRVAAVREAVGDHAGIDGGGPGEQDFLGQRPVGFEAGVAGQAVADGEVGAEGFGGEQQAADADEGVAAPIGEPGEAGDQRVPAVDLGEVLAGGLSEAGIGVALGGFGFGEDGDGPGGGGVGTEGEGGGAGEVPGEDAGAGEVLGVVQAAVALGGVEKAAEPFGRRLPGAAMEGDGGDAGVGAEAKAAGGGLGGEVEGRVLVVESVVVAAGEQGADVEGGGAGAVAGPAEAGLAAGDEEFLDEHAAVGEVEHPAWPGRVGEGADPGGAVGVDDAGGVALAADGGGAVLQLDPGLDAVDEDEAAGRGLGEEKGVVAAGADAVGRTGGEPAGAVRFKPFRAGPVCRGRDQGAVAGTIAVGMSGLSSSGRPAMWL